MVQGADGNFYGTTYSGGADCGRVCDGTVFKITPEGMLTTLHNFNGGDGSNPNGLVLGMDGNFYGTTFQGGTGTSCGTDGCGTVFVITPSGTVTTLHSFDKTDGSFPYAGLIQATDGNFYGTTYEGGTNDDGTVFKVTTDGALTTLHSFDGTDGSSMLAGIFQSTNGNFYGTATNGGTIPDSCGTVFRLSVGLGPFAETLPTSGKVGREVVILGNNLTAATSVTFNGTEARFRAVSGTEIRTRVLNPRWRNRQAQGD